MIGFEDVSPDENVISNFEIAVSEAALWNAERYVSWDLGYEAEDIQ
jgi:hypothetical protein